MLQLLQFVDSIGSHWIDIRLFLCMSAVFTGLHGCDNHKRTNSTIAWRTMPTELESDSDNNRIVKIFSLHTRSAAAGWRHECSADSSTWSSSELLEIEPNVEYRTELNLYQSSLPLVGLRTWWTASVSRAGARRIDHLKVCCKVWCNSTWADTVTSEWRIPKPSWFSLDSNAIVVVAVVLPIVFLIAGVVLTSAFYRLCARQKNSAHRRSRSRSQSRGETSESMLNDSPATVPAQPAPHNANKFPCRHQMRRNSRLGDSQYIGSSVADTNVSSAEVRSEYSSQENCTYLNQAHRLVVADDDHTYEPVVRILPAAAV